MLSSVDGEDGAIDRQLIECMCCLLLQILLWLCMLCLIPFLYDYGNIHIYNYSSICNCASQFGCLILFVEDEDS